MTDRKELERLVEKTGACLVLDCNGYIDHVLYKDKEWPCIAFAEKAREETVK